MRIGYRSIIQSKGIMEDYSFLIPTVPHISFDLFCLIYGSICILNNIQGCGERERKKHFIVRVRRSALEKFLCSCHDGICEAIGQMDMS